MGGKRQAKDEGTIIAAKPATVDELRATLSRWPQLWAVEDRDVELGRRLTECLGLFLWPRITETAQRAFDATCRKLYHCLQQQERRK